MDPEFLLDWKKKLTKMQISCTEITKPRIFLFLFSHFYLIVILEELQINSSSFPLFKDKKKKERQLSLQTCPINLFSKESRGLCCQEILRGLDRVPT